MREHVQEASFQRQDQIQHQIIEQVKSRARNGFIAIVIFALFIAALALYRYYSTASLVQDGLFYQNDLMSKEMFPFWQKMFEEEVAEDKQAIIQQGQHKISRKQLGRMGWTILHMITGSFPEDIPPNLIKKFNTFLILWGQFYPCKLCSGHFLKLLKDVGPFTGTKKQELMIYLCDMHNKVNKRLGKPIHDCTNVKQEWNSCGCSEQN